MNRKIDPNSLTIDYKKLMRLSIQDRIGFYNNGGASYFESLTPTQLANLLPKQYIQSMPNLSRAVSGGTKGVGGTMASLASPGTGTSTSPATSAPTATPSGPKPTASQPAKEQSFLDYVRKMSTPQDKTQTGFQLSGNTSVKPVVPDNRGLINRDEYYKQAVNTFKNSSLNGFVPKDGERYGIRKGTPEEWANLAMRTAHVESGFRVGTTNSNDPGGSYGIFQFGFHYGINKDNWRDPQAQLDAFTTYAKTWVKDGGGYILPPPDVKDVKRYKGHGGFGAVFSTFRDNKVNSKDAWSVSTGIEIRLASTQTPAPTEQQPGYAHPTGNQGRVSSNFGMRVHPISGVKKMHTGVDFAVGMGTPVQSIAEGKVIFAGTRGGYGYTVDVQHADGTVSRYAHLSEFKSKVGDTVKSGQVVALSGGAKGHPGAGTSTGAHLHFEVRKDDKAVDPTPYLQQQMPSPVSPGDIAKNGKVLDIENLDPKLQSYVKSLPVNQQQELLRNENLSALWNKWSQDNPTATAKEAQQAAQKVIETVQNTPANQVNKIVREGEVYKIWDEGSVPSRAERRDIREKGGIVINLDTNKGGKNQQTGPLIVIPDNSSPEIRQRAQEYVKKFESAYKEQFGSSIEGKVVTRSENQRGRSNTIHTEPYSVNDTKAVKFFHGTPEGRALLADITASTLGKIPGSQFSLPHDPFKPGPDVGATSDTIAGHTEIVAAKGLIAAMKQRESDYQKQADAQVAKLETPVQTAVPAGQPQAQPGDYKLMFNTSRAYTETEVKSMIDKYGKNLIIGANMDEPEEYNQVQALAEKYGLPMHGYSMGRGAPQSGWGNTFPQEQQTIKERAKAMGISVDQWYNGGWMDYEIERLKKLGNKSPKQMEMDSGADAKTPEDLEKEILKFDKFRKDSGIKTRMVTKHWTQREYDVYNKLVKEKKIDPDILAGLNIVETKHQKGLEKATAQAGQYFGEMPEANFESYATKTPLTQPSPNAPSPAAKQAAPLPPPPAATPTPPAASPSTPPPPPAQTAPTAPAATSAQVKITEEKNDFGNEPAKPNKTGGNYQTTRENRAVVNLDTGKTELTFQGGPGGEDFSMQDGRLEITPRSRTNPDSLRQPEMPPKPQQPTSDGSSELQNMAGMFSGAQPQTYTPPTVSAHNNFTDRLEPASMPQNDGIMRAMAQSIGFHDAIGSNYGYGTAARIRNGYDTTLA